MRHMVSMQTEREEKQPNERDECGELTEKGPE